MSPYVSGGMWSIQAEGKVRTDRLEAGAATRAEPAESVELGLLSRALQLHLAQAALQLPYLRLLLLQLGLRWR